jgi:outer membrane lipoprotein SlyB
MSNAFSSKWSDYNAPAPPPQRSAEEQAKAKKQADIWRQLGLIAPVAGTAIGAVGGGIVGGLGGGAAGSVVPGAGTAVGAGAGIMAGAGAGAKIGNALGSGVGEWAGYQASQLTAPEEEAEMKRRAQQQAFAMLIGGRR